MNDYEETKNRKRNVSVMESQLRAGLLSFVMVMACVGVAAAQGYSDKIAAVVNGSVILDSDVKQQKQPFIRNFFQLPLGIVPPGKWPTEKEILDELIVITLLEQEAAQKNLNLDERSVELSIQEMMKRNNLPREKFLVMLTYNGMNYTDFVKIWKRHLRLTRLIGSEVAAKVAMSEEDAQRYWKEHRDTIAEEYKKLTQSAAPAQQPQQQEQALPTIPKEMEIHTGGKIRLRQITLKLAEEGKDKTKNAQNMEKAKQTMERIREEYLRGADFADLAKKYSQDHLAPNGGDLGYMNYKDMQPALQELVQTMKVGDIQTAGTKEAVFIFLLAEAKGRQTKKAPIPEKIRKKMEADLKKQREQIEEQKKQRESQARRNETMDEPEPAPRKASSGDTKSGKEASAGLTPEETKEYEKVRDKVAAVVRSEKIQARLKEWIDQLKKNAIIDVKI